MDKIHNIENHDFYNELVKDANQYLAGKDFEVFDIEIPKETEFDEIEFYIHNVGFYTSYFIKWLKQLDFAIEILSNYDYKKDSKYNRVDHLIYNIENYIIRFQSVSDRLLQVINGVFHLTINENDVKGTVIMNNLKVSRTSVQSKYSPIKKHLKKLYNERNTIIHRHSYLEKELRKLELFYEADKKKIDSRIKTFRTQKLKEYLEKKKEEYSSNNQKLFELIPVLFDELLIEYKKQRNRLIKITRQ